MITFREQFKPPPPPSSHTESPYLEGGQPNLAHRFTLDELKSGAASSLWGGIPQQDILAYFKELAGQRATSGPEAVTFSPMGPRGVTMYGQGSGGLGQGFGGDVYNAWSQGQGAKREGWTQRRTENGGFGYERPREARAPRSGSFGASRSFNSWLQTPGGGR